MAASSDAPSDALILPDWADELPVEWQWRRLDSVCREIVDCPHSTPEIVDSGPYLMARTSDILTGMLRADEARQVSEATYVQRTRRIEPMYGDLLYSREGTYFGVSAEVPANTKVCLGQRMVLLRPDSKQVLPTFLRYWLNSPRVRAHVLGHRDGSVAERLNLPTIRALPVCAPSLMEQHAIADVLGTLDDKIELNRRMNATLEAMVRALFKSWFVDFDPVRAEAEGRAPDLPIPFANLFPNSFEDSELGEIPRGWRVGSLKNVLFLQRGFDLPATQRTPGAYPVLAASGPSGTHNEFMVRGPGVTTGRSGVLGRVFYVADNFWPLNTSLWVKEFRHSRPAYAFHLMQRLDFALLNAGSAVPTLNRNHVHMLPTLLPPIGLIDAFERVATASLHHQEHNVRQSTTLAAMRDALLPKLISGDLRVTSTHRVIEGHARA